MRKVVIAALGLMLAATCASAQRIGGGRFHGGGIAVGRPIPSGHIRGGVRHFGHSQFGNGAVLVDGPWWGYEESYREPGVAPPVVIVERDAPPAPPATPPPPVKAQVIDVAAPALPPRSVSAPPAVFIYTNGERQEASRYTITSEYLYLGAGRQQRRVLLSALDLNATTAANRERGIQLRIPAESNEVFLAF